MWTFDASSSVLLVVDMQRDFVEEGRPMEVPMARERIPQMRQLVDGARAAGVPVVFTQHVLTDRFNISPLESSNNPRLLTEGMRDGTDGIEVVEGLDARPGDHYVRKHRYDAFYNTTLEVLLNTVRGYRTVDTLVIAGTLTEVCCESTARSAFMRDFKVAFAGESTGALSDSAQAATLDAITRYFGRVMTNAEILQGFADGAVEAGL